MKTKILHLRRRVFAGAIIFAFAFRGLANPTGLTVVSGAATAQSSGSQLNITAENNAFLNWQTFNIAVGERTVFNQPGMGSIVWNRINDQNPSQIYGSLQANGVVVLLNSSGFYFGPNSFISAAGLVVSTANCTPPQNTGGAWVFNGPPPLASIINYGNIKVGNGGSVYLIADKVENHGGIEAPGGSIGLAAGQTVTLSERPDGRGMSMQVALPQGSVDNYGNLIADGGTMALNARVVNQNGLVQANSIRNTGGVIELVASDLIDMGADSQLSAQGDASLYGSGGGQVTVKSQGTFTDVTGSRINVSGGANGGNGGQVEISAPTISSIHTKMNGSAQHGGRGGSMFLDPSDINLDLSLYFGFSSIDVQANKITVDSYWGLLDTIGNADGQLKLEAAQDIVMSDGSAILGSFQPSADGLIPFCFDYSGNPTTWSVTLRAGVDFTTGLVKSGKGSILLNGSALIQTAAGDITLEAGQDIKVGVNALNGQSGSITTWGGGSINAMARGGSINTGSAAYGYDFNKPLFIGDVVYAPNTSLGGISTAAGGSVNLTAGLDITSFMPVNGNQGDAGSGAFGVNADPTIKDTVNIVAGRNVTGHFIVANGSGQIVAGAKMDARGNPLDQNGNVIATGGTGFVTDPNSLGSAGNNNQRLALSLIDGSWAVNASSDIILQEVRNPNGIFNNNFNSSVSAYGYHQFDYSPDASVSLTAGNSVQLLGGSLPRNSGAFEQGIPEIFAPSLNIHAGLGGIILGQDIILFPSATGVGELSLQTTGPLESLAVQKYLALSPALQAASARPSEQVSIIMSDADRLQYLASGNFGVNDHANNPLYLNHETTASVSVGGDLNNIVLSFPEAAQVTVHGNMDRSTVIAQNLKPTDVTQVNVTGDIINRDEFTTVSVTAAPDLALLQQAYGDETALFARLHYDPVSQTLTYQGHLSLQDGALLAKLPVQVVDQYGIPQFDTFGNPILQYKQVLDAATISKLVAGSADVPINQDQLSGFIIGGGGTFKLTAHSLNLGTTAGIRSEGPDLNSALAYVAHLTRGADINVNLTGDLNMFSTAIASYNGGNININVGGNVQVGSSTFSGFSDVARGIFASAKSDVTVIANGNIDVNGSRIAAYDGGNVTVESLNGNINAGNGGNGSVGVEEIYVDPVTYQIYKFKPTIPGSGILATTFPTRNKDIPAPEQGVGNILVEAPNGNIDASAGGIVQLPFNNVKSPNAVVTVLAGYEERDANGQRVLATDSQKALVEQLPVSAADLVNNPAHTAIIDGQKFQISATVWTQLLALLEISSSDPVVNLHLIGDGSEFINHLTSDGIGLADSINYLTPFASGKNINANGSGVIASNARLKASGDINGVVFARNNIDLAAKNNVNVTALAQGIASVNSGGSISGTIIGVGGVSASGSSIDASLLSQNISASGDSSSAKEGFGQGTAANATANAATASDDSTKRAKKSGAGEEDSFNKKKGIALAQKVSRVTVILPPKKVSEKTQPNNSL